MVRLLGDDWEGKRVLDVGCASGYYFEWLGEKGAHPVGLDVSEQMVEGLKERLGADAEVHWGDIAGETPYLEAGSFDAVVASLVLHAIEDWDHVFPKLYGLLKPGGRLVFSVQHPMTDFLSSPTQDYFQTELVWQAWKQFGILMPSYRRSLTEIWRVLSDAGFKVVNLVEPAPLESVREANPARYARMVAKPPFLCLDCVR